LEIYWGITVYTTGRQPPWKIPGCATGLRSESLFIFSILLNSNLTYSSQGFSGHLVVYRTCLNYVTYSVILPYNNIYIILPCVRDIKSVLLNCEKKDMGISVYD